MSDSIVREESGIAFIYTLYFNDPSNPIHNVKVKLHPGRILGFEVTDRVMGYDGVRSLRKYYQYCALFPAQKAQDQMYVDYNHEFARATFIKSDN